MKVLNKNEANVLSTLSHVLYLSLDEIHFFTTLTKFFKENSKGQIVSAYKINDNGIAILMAQNGMPSENNIELQKGEGAPAYIARSKRAYFSNSVERDPVFAREAKMGVRAELAFPIMADGVVLGSIHCQILDGASEFVREDINFAIEMMNEIKGPIQNMKMYLQAKQLNESLLRTIELKEKELQDSRIGTLRNNDSFKIIEKEIIGRSRPMKDLMALVDKISDKNITAFLIGEAGTGKEMIARRMHCRSLRRDRAFVAIDCSAFGEKELEIELFGDENKMGMLEACHFGTLFINSIEKLSLSLQNKLLNYINNGMGVKANGKDFFRSDVRIISASHVDINELVSLQKFREELYFSLSAVVLKVPALRERKEDIEVLANFFLNANKIKEMHKTFSSVAMKILLEHQWNGNVRELQSVVERAYILADGIVVEDLHMDQYTKMIQPKEEVKEVVVKKVEFVQITLSDLEKSHIMSTLENLNGNKTKASKALGITVKTLYNKLHSYGIDFDKEA